MAFLPCLESSLSLIHFTYMSEHFLREVDSPGGSVVKESAYQCRRHRRLWFDPWVGKIPWRRKWQPTSVFLKEEPGGLQSIGLQRVGHD